MKLDCNCNVNSKREIHKCSSCEKTLCGKHLYFYIDESNIAITKNAPGYCLDCYKKKYKR